MAAGFLKFFFKICNSQIAEDLADEFDKRLGTATRRVSVITLGKAGTGQPLIKYPRVHFHPRFFFAFGSPIGKYSSFLP